MGLFEVQRLLEGPSLRGSQALRDLLMDLDNVEGVWLVSGHVFAAYWSGDERKVHIFDQVPVKVLPFDGSNQVGVASKVIEILLFDQDTVLIVETTGIVHVLKYFADDYHWMPTCKFMLYTEKGGVTSATLCGHGQLIYSVRDASQDGWNHSVYSVYINSGEGGAVELSDHTHLLSHCPPLCFYAGQLGVWLVPKSGETVPANLLMYWNEHDKHIQPIIWSDNDLHVMKKLHTKSFKALCQRTAIVWSKVSVSSPLICFAVHPVSFDFMCLTENGSVYQLIETAGSCRQKLFIKLNDFSERYPSPKHWFSSSTNASLELFFLHTYLGICHRGELRLYDTNTGEFIWECDDLDHPTTKLLVPPTTPFTNVPPPVSLWNQSGVYFLRCKRISDHAQMFVDSLFPIATNADETTPGDYLDNGEILAAQLCHLWSLDMLASQYTIKIAHELLMDTNVTESNHTPLSRLLPPELLELMGHLSVQNPVICVALMSQYPVYRKTIADHLTRFLQRYYDNVSNSIQTPLNAQTAPLLSKYLELSQQYDNLLATPTFPVDHTPSIQERVYEILECSQQSTVVGDPTVHLRAELLSYSFSHPLESLSGIKQFMRIKTTFAEAVLSLQQNLGEFDLNWRGLLASEIAEKIPEKSLKPTPQIVRLPVFEVATQLLYAYDPQDLPSFVSFVHMVRDQQSITDSTYARQCRKGYFYHRAVDTLTPPTSESSTDQTRSYCQILLMSDHTNSEINALTLLLEHHMWQDVIEMLHQVHSMVSPSIQCALFYRTLCHLSKEGLLHKHIDSIWSLLPESFSVLEFMDVLKLSARTSHRADQVYIEEEDGLTVAQIIPYVLELLSQQKTTQQQQQQQ